MPVKTFATPFLYAHVSLVQRQKRNIEKMLTDCCKNDTNHAVNCRKMKSCSSLHAYFLYLLLFTERDLTGQKHVCRKRVSCSVRCCTR